LLHNIQIRLVKDQLDRRFLHTFTALLITTIVI
jgi:hypothetical protein